MEKRSVKLKEITSYISRGITPDYVDEGLCVINQKCVRNNKISYAPSRCTSLTKKVPKEKMLKRGDILINSTGTGTLGRVAYKDDDLESTFDGHVTVLRVSDEINSRYINYYLNELQSQLENLGLGSTNQLEFSLLFSPALRHLNLLHYQLQRFSQWNILACMYQHSLQASFCTDHNKLSNHPLRHLLKEYHQNCNI